MISHAASRVSKPSCTFSYSSRNSSSSSLILSTSRGAASSSKALSNVLSTRIVKDHKFNKQVNLSKWLTSTTNFSLIETKEYNQNDCLPSTAFEENGSDYAESVFLFDNDDEELVLGDDLEQYYYRKNLSLQNIDVSSVFNDICSQLDTQYLTVFRENNINDFLINFDVLLSGNA